jgi:hypothetical protein
MTSKKQTSGPLKNLSSTEDSRADFIQALYVERYKYILQEIHALNENIHKYLSLFQALATALATAGVAVFVGREQLKLSSDVAGTAIQGLLGLLVILAAFVILSIGDVRLF